MAWALFLLAHAQFEVMMPLLLTCITLSVTLCCLQLRFPALLAKIVQKVLCMASLKHQIVVLGKRKGRANLQGINFKDPVGDQLDTFDSTALQADVFDVKQWKSQLEGTIGLVSCLGGFGSNDFMYKV